MMTMCMLQTMHGPILCFGTEMNLLAAFYGKLYGTKVALSSEQNTHHCKRLMRHQWLLISYMYQHNSVQLAYASMIC